MIRIEIDFPFSVKENRKRAGSVCPKENKSREEKENSSDRKGNRGKKNEKN